MRKPKFSRGDRVKTNYWGDTRVLRIVRHLPHPKEYEGVMDELYLMSDGKILKERYLEAIDNAAMAG